LPLIGGKTAIKIIKYRNLIGGFVSLNQLKEVWGFKDSMLMVNEKRIAIDASKISKININAAGVEQLKKHPYIKFNKAKLLIAFREQHGKYHTADELKNSKAFTDEDIKKIEPYLIFE
jgi:DNA uptake protein ComE-like DNA-binding protein